MFTKLVKNQIYNFCTKNKNLTFSNKIISKPESSQKNQPSVKKFEQNLYSFSLENNISYDSDKVKFPALN